MPSHETISIWKISICDSTHILEPNYWRVVEVLNRNSFLKYSLEQKYGRVPTDTPDKLRQAVFDHSLHSSLNDALVLAIKSPENNTLFTRSLSSSEGHSQEWSRSTPWSGLMSSCVFDYDHVTGHVVGAVPIESIVAPPLNEYQPDRLNRQDATAGFPTGQVRSKVEYEIIMHSQYLAVIFLQGVCKLHPFTSLRSDQYFNFVVAGMLFYHCVKLDRDISSVYSKIVITVPCLSLGK